jgi:hypothetical protein
MLALRSVITYLYPNPLEAAQRKVERSDGKEMRRGHAYERD